MNLFLSHNLSIVLWLPVIGAVILLLIPKTAKGAIRWVSLLTAILTLVASIPLYFKFSGAVDVFQFAEKYRWIPAWNCSYHLGIDGISMPMILLTTFLSVLAIWFSFTIEDRVKEYMIFFLMLETGMLGVFMSLDLILFYVFWEAMLIPMYFLIGIWGGTRRLYAAIKFFIYTFAGSLLMLVAIVSLYMMTGTFDLLYMHDRLANGMDIPLNTQIWLFAAFALAFAIKVPLFPFHTWLPDAHVEAPTAGSVILAGVLLKMGTYGFMRFCLPMFPEASISAVPWIAGLAVIGIIYGGIVAAMQADVKKLVAYSSVAHLGFVMLGLFALNSEGITGSLLQQVNHGLSTGALFMLVGIIYLRRHTRLFADFGGLKSQMPIYAGLFLIVMLSSVGLPSLNGFVGEFLCLLGAFKASYSDPTRFPFWISISAIVGVVIAAVYLLWMFQKLFYGENKNPENQKLRDVKWWETAIMAAFVIFIFWFGLYPKILTDKMKSSVNLLVEQVNQPRGERPSWYEIAPPQIKKEAKLP